MAVSKNTPHSPQAATPTRTESDSFGPIDVVADRYWGAQTERSRRNFRIGEEKMPQPLVRALAMIKKAAALANVELGLIEEETAAALDCPRGTVKSRISRALDRLRLELEEVEA